MTNTAPYCHIYGKLPAHGDFISRGLAGGRDQAVDARLAASMALAKQNWGSEFEETYLSAQPWLFASAQGTAIIIPSVDKVGRKFPLYLAVLKGIVLQFLYDTVIAAISEGHEADHLIGALAQALERETAPDNEPDGRWFCIDPDAPSLPACWDETSLTLGKSGEVT